MQSFTELNGEQASSQRNAFIVFFLMGTGKILLCNSYPSFRMDKNV